MPNLVPEIAQISYKKACASDTITPKAHTSTSQGHTQVRFQGSALVQAQHLHNGMQDKNQRVACRHMAKPCEPPVAFQVTYVDIYLRTVRVFSWPAHYALWHPFKDGREYAQEPRVTPKHELCQNNFFRAVALVCTSVRVS